MNKRLQKLIHSLGLSSAQFADEVGVQRSSVSHVISGRNKPSMDFIEKILKIYPKVNADWLILGSGDMFKGSDLFSMSQSENILERRKIESVSLEKEHTNPTVPKEEKLAKKTDSIPSKELPVDTACFLNAERIVLFYADGTFREYRKSED